MAFSSEIREGNTCLPFEEQFKHVGRGTVDRF